MQRMIASFAGLANDQPDEVVRVDGRDYPSPCIFEDDQGIRIFATSVFRECAVSAALWGRAFADAPSALAFWDEGQRRWWGITVERWMDLRREVRLAGHYVVDAHYMAAFHDFPGYFEIAASTTEAGSLKLHSEDQHGLVHLHAHSEFCLAPETRVVTADLKWKRIDEVVAGEQLVGFDEDLRPPDGERGNSRSKMRRTEVLGVKRVVRDCYRITLEDGTEIVASAQHGWVVNGTTRGSQIAPGGPSSGLGPNTRRWVTTEELLKGRTTPSMILWAKPWGDVPEDLIREAGWLAGVADGEGWLHEGQFSFGQNPGPVFDEMKRVCKALGYPITADRVQSSKGECRTFRLAGYEAVVRFLAQCKPVRFADRADEAWVGRRAGSRHTRPVRIVSVEHLGDRETIAIETTTKTFVAEGFLSHNSALDGFSHVAEMVEQAVLHGQEAIALTDHGVCAGHPALQAEAKKAGIKPVFGIEAYFVDDRRFRPMHKPVKAQVTDSDQWEKALAEWNRQQQLGKDYWHLVLWAQNDRGLKNIWAMSSEAQREGMYRKPRMDWDTLARHSEGVMVSTACLRGPLSAALINEDHELAQQRLGRLLDIFQGRVHIEIHTNALPEQRLLNERLVVMANDFSLPVVAVSDSHYPTDQHQQCHKVWIATQINKDLQDDGDLFAGSESYHLLGETDARSALSYLPEHVVDAAIANTSMVARSCDASIQHRSAVPVFSKRPTREESIHRDIERLVEICMSNWHKVVGKRHSQEVYEARFEREMKLLISKGFCGYFLMVADYCLDPSTPVLTADMRWVEVGKLEVGDKLAGFDEDRVTKNVKGHRYWRTAEVLNTRRIVLPTYSVTLADGTKTITSGDHQWLVADPSGSSIRWVRTEELKIGQRPQRLVQEWGEPDTWAAGYLAGILDGEGSLSFSQMNNGGRSLSLGFAQKEGVVLDTALRILDSWGFDYSVKDHGKKRNGLRSVWLRGGRAEVMRLLGMVRPQRLLAKLDMDLLGRLISIDQPPIVSIESLGLGEVVALETTTGTLVAQGFAHHNCRWARARGILVGPGRGSGGGSLVAYLCNITEIDPVDAELIFERFLTDGRKGLPDFDVDFPSSKRDELTEYVIGLYGEDHVVRVGSHMYMRNKKTVRALAKVLASTIEIHYPDIDEICKVIDMAEADSAGLGRGWDEVWAAHPQEYERYANKYPMLFEMAELFVGRLNAYGKHAAGVVISPDAPLTGEIPMRYDADTGHAIAEWNMDQLDEIGLVKFDLLTIRNLDTLQEAVELDRQLTGEVIDLYSWKDEYADEQVWDEICLGRTLGMFQIETYAGTAMCKRHQPRSMADLADVITLVRPGPMRSGLTDTYLRRRFGEEPVSFPHPLLEQTLSKTYGCILYQEDVMNVCMVLAGYDENEADAVRKILGKKKVEEARKAGEKFVLACDDRGISRSVSEPLWAQMEEFAKYCVTGDTVVSLAAAGPSSDGTVTVGELYRRIHTPLLEPVRGRTRSGEEYRGPCVVCGTIEATKFTRGACSVCYGWRRKFSDPARGLQALALHEDGRIRPARLLDVFENGDQEVWRVTLADGRFIDATADHKHLTPEGERRVDQLVLGDALLADAGYEPQGYNPDRDRLTVGGRSGVGAVNGAFGEANVGFIDGGHALWAEFRRSAPNYCHACGATGGRLEVAHIDGNRKNNAFENLALWCVSCHKKFDYANNDRRRRWGKGHPVAPVEITSIVYVGVRPTYTVVMSAPHNWVGNGIVTTNSFNRAHAFGYAIIAYWCAWMKVRRPLAFLTAILSTVDADRLPDFVEEARQRGFVPLGPDINTSDRRFAVVSEGAS